MSLRIPIRSCLSTVLMALCAAFLLMIPANATAQQEDGLLYDSDGKYPPGPLYRNTYASKITGKLWSGISNTLFCWVEIPVEMNEEIQSTDPFTGTFVGLGQGLFFTGQRLVLGLVDIVTFPVDVYSNNYTPIQRTPFPFIDEVE